MEKATPQREAALTCTDIQETKAYTSPSQELVIRIKKALPKLSKVRSRLLIYLSHRDEDTTGSICDKCSIGNLSDMVSKINPILEDVGLRIIHYAPPVRLTNQFGEKTPVDFWKLVLRGVEK
jgi:hypothetical protein